MRRTTTVAVSAFAVLVAGVQCTHPAAVSGQKISSSARPADATISPSATPAPSTATRFTVSGSHPVQPNGSQDSYEQTPGAVCDRRTLAADKDLGHEISTGFTLAGFPVAAALLSHFLGGQGTEIDYPAGSPIAKAAAVSRGFQMVSRAVQAEIATQLRAGSRRIRLTAGQLPLVVFGATTTDLYWAFRGTQGLAVTGSGSLEHGEYVGNLSYVIRDSYGFSTADVLDNFGPPMRYLQTVCGAPQHTGGAHWFPDTVTVTVPFSQPA